MKSLTLLMAFIIVSVWGIDLGSVWGISLASVWGIKLASVWGTSNAAAEAADRGYILSQTKLALQCTLSVSSRGIKYGPDALGICYVAKAPDWTLYKYNDKTKTYFAASPETLSSMRKALAKTVLALPDGSSPLPPGMLSMLSSQQFTKGPATTIAGLQATDYSSPRGRDFSHVYVAQDIAVPAKLNQVADYIFDTPVGIHDNNRILLRREVVDKHGRKIFLDTTFCRRADLPPSTFDAPRGYRLVKSIDQVGGG